LWGFGFGRGEKTSRHRTLSAVGRPTPSEGRGMGEVSFGGDAVASGSPQSNPEAARVSNQSNTLKKFKVSMMVMYMCTIYISVLKKKYVHYI
jgi:hypothetical protein